MTPERRDHNHDAAGGEPSASALRAHIEGNARLAGEEFISSPGPTGAKRQVEPAASAPVSGKGGPSAAALAKVLVHDPAVRAACRAQPVYTLRLSARDPDPSVLVRKVPALLRQFGERFPTSALILSLDLSPKQRPHLHGIVFMPPGVNANVVIAIFCRLFFRGMPGRWVRPARKAQYVKRIAPEDLRWLLEHHLRGPRRTLEPDAIPMNWRRMWDRTWACGFLGRAWERATCSSRLAGAPPAHLRPLGPACSFKASALALLRAARPGSHVCRWCGKDLPQHVRKDMQFHPRGCRQSAHRALTNAIKNHGPAVREHVEKFEAKGYLRPDAIRAAIAAMQWWGKQPLATVLLCACGKPLAKRIGSRTCGHATCRSRRKRLRDAARRAQHDVTRLEGE